MDEIDKKIIEILKQDSSQPYTTIAKQVALSEGAVRKRIQNLVKEGIIRKFTIQLGTAQGAKALTLVSAAPTPEVAKQIARLENIETVYEITGQHDIAVVLSAPTIEKINETVDRIREISGVTNTNTMIVLKHYS